MLIKCVWNLASNLPERVLYMYSGSSEHNAASFFVFWHFFLVNNEIHTWWDSLAIVVSVHSLVFQLCIYGSQNLSDNCKLSKKKKENKKVWYDIYSQENLRKSNSTMLQTWLLQVSNSFVNQEVSLRYTVYSSLKVWSIWSVTLWHVVIRSPRYSQVHLEIAKYHWKVFGCMIVENWLKATAPCYGRLELKVDVC